MQIKRIGQFQVLGELGTGAHSTILRVRRPEDNRTYALKVVPIHDSSEHKFYEQARHEFRVAQMLDHPNLLKVHAVEVQRDWLFRMKKVHLLLEYVHGKTVDQMQGLSVPRLVQIFAKVTAGLMHMHRRGVCHADLKPGNILVSRQGDVKVIDFGLAWIKGEPKERVQGTPEYMAPEQSRASTVNERTDLYNLGATMYRLVTWRLPPPTVPQQGSVAMTAKLFDARLKRVDELNPKTPPELCKLIHRCLSFTPQGRPDRVSEVLEVLEDLRGRLVRNPEDQLDTIDWESMGKGP